MLKKLVSFKKNSIILWDNENGRSILEDKVKTQNQGIMDSVRKTTYVNAVHDYHILCTNITSNI